MQRMSICSQGVTYPLQAILPTISKGTDTMWLFLPPAWVGYGATPRHGSRDKSLVGLGAKPLKSVGSED